jgi:hypothetical protein
MPASLEFLLGLLEREGTALVSHEDFAGKHGTALRLWQEMGFIASEPGTNPVPSCPHCGAGVPYLLLKRYVCNRCASTVDRRHLLLWPLDLGAFLGWLAGKLRLRGGVRKIEDRLWQLGTWDAGGDARECFYRHRGRLSEREQTRLAAYRNVLILYGLTRPPDVECRHGTCISLLELLRMDDVLQVADLRPLLATRGNVRFEAHSGELWVGDALLGEVPVGSKEYFFLRCLAQHLDHFVSYADLKHEVLRHAGSRDTTEEATFCQGLKSRIKKKWVPEIGRLIATTKKADGYRLRGQVEL